VKTMSNAIPPGGSRKGAKPAAAQAITQVLLSFEGIDEVEVEEAEPDPNDGTIIPAAVSFGLTPNAYGVHILEFIAWAVSDMESAGASVHLHLESQPPWLNEPGRSLAVSIYVNPRSDECSVAVGLREIEEEMSEMAAFLQDTYQEYWPACRPQD
jgi:hypothetical protein